MSVSSGFFPSIGLDRVYSNDQMGIPFDNLVKDGVLYHRHANNKRPFEVAPSGSSISIDEGQAWFDHTWFVNDGLVILGAEEGDIDGWTSSSVDFPRWDAVCIVINKTQDVRSSYFAMVNGTPSNNPSKPEIQSSVDVTSYPIAYVYRERNSSSVSASNIEYNIGSESCPWARNNDYDIIEMNDDDVDEIWRSVMGD